MSVTAEIVRRQFSDTAEAVADRCLALLQKRDLQFVTTVLALRNVSVLKRVATGWAADPSPWARSEEERYLEMGPVGASQRAVIRTLIWQSIRNRRHRTLAAAMVYLDQSLEQRWKQQYWLDRSVNPYKVKTIAVLKRIGLSPKSAIAMRRAFRMRSTYYFQRILFRYMMRLAQESPDEYVACIGYAWRRYRNDKTTEGIGVIQRTCLLRTMFVPSEFLRWTRGGYELAPEGTLQQWLDSGIGVPNEECWRTERGIRELQRVAHQSDSDFVRRRARELLIRFLRA